MAKKGRKGRARRGKKGHSLRRRYGRSSLPTGGLRMNVSGVLQLDPESLETVIEEDVQIAV